MKNVVVSLFHNFYIPCATSKCDIAAAITIAIAFTLIWTIATVSIMIR